MCCSTPEPVCTNSESRKQQDRQEQRKTHHQSSSRGLPRSNHYGKFQQNKGRQIRHVEQNYPNNESSGSGSETDEDIGRILQHLNVHRTTQPQSTTNKCKVWINGCQIEVEPDTGADANIMDERQFDRLLRAMPDLELCKMKIKLKTLKADLPVVGECDATIENETRTTDAKIIIIQGKMDSLPLLVRQTLEELGMVKFDATGGLKQPNRETTKNVHKLETGSDEVVHRHKKLFEGIGKAQRDGQDIEIHLPLKENAIPITQKPRRVPNHLMDPLKKRISEFVENDIMEEVPTHESITWCSPLVVQPKPKNPNNIRVSLDL